MEFLEENIRSPQFQQALSHLSAALMSDGNSNAIFANFSLDPADGMEAMNRGDGIKAFLDAMVAASRREEAKEEGGAMQEEEEDEGDKDT